VLVRLTTERLKRGFLPSLHLIIARALLDTSAWRIEVDPSNSVAQPART
jgi:hypothetical protein